MGKCKWFYFDVVVVIAAAVVAVVDQDNSKHAQKMGWLSKQQHLKKSIRIVPFKQ